MNTFLKTITLATVVAGAIVLAGCTSTPAPAPTTSQSATAAPLPSATEAPAPAAESNTGDIIDADTAASLNAAIRTAGDDRAYQLPDGTYVFLRSGDALPESVSAAVTSRVKESQSPDFNSTDSGAQGKAIDAVWAAVAQQESATGKQFIVVSHLLSYVDASGSWEPAWGLNKGSFGPQDSYEAAMAIAQQWVDKAPASRGIIYLDTLS